MPVYQAGISIQLCVQTLLYIYIYFISLIFYQITIAMATWRGFPWRKVPCKSTHVDRPKPRSNTVFFFLFFFFFFFLGSSSQQLRATRRRHHRRRFSLRPIHPRHRPIRRRPQHAHRKYRLTLHIVPSKQFPQLRGGGVRAPLTVFFCIRS